MVNQGTKDSAAATCTLERLKTMAWRVESMWTWRGVLRGMERVERKERVGRERVEGNEREGMGARMQH